MSNPLQKVFLGFWTGVSLLPFILVTVVPLILTPISASGSSPNVCVKTAAKLQIACRNDVRGDFFTTYAVCLNLSEKSDRNDCLKEAGVSRREGNQECRSIRKARKELCELVGPEAYEPPFGVDFASNFVDPLEIGGLVEPNTYFPLVPGSEWTYQSTFVDDEGETVTETIRVMVTDKTKHIEGITCLTVKDIVDEDGEIIEDTDDWYAQDTEGNVWYCGEIAENFETFENDDPADPELTDIDGSWKAGRDGAVAGVLMPATPIVGTVIRQEVKWREAEDVVEIESLTGTEASMVSSCTGDCLVTRDFTPLDPGVDEYKYYAPNIGLILEVDSDGNRVELISYSIP
ncbi:MAG: hypothetical protein ACR2QW_08415 [bacterium]